MEAVSATEFLSSSKYGLGVKGRSENQSLIYHIWKRVKFVTRSLLSEDVHPY